MPSNQSIKVRLSGGLGNQLFKSMAGIKIAESQNSKLGLDTTWYSYQNGNSNLVSNRIVELDYFENLTNLILPPSTSIVFHQRSGQILRRMPRAFRSAIGYVLESDISRIEQLKVRTLDGNFEDLNLLPSCEKLTHYLKFPLTTSSWFDSMAIQLAHEDPIAIHVRMGDYLKFPKIYGFISKKYYLDALDKLGATSKSRIWLFSDEPEKALQWLGNIPFKVEVLNVPQSVRSGEVMRLMSLSKSLVIAHSTFSWWAGMLGNLNLTNEVVVMPSRFLSSQAVNDCDLIVPSWFTIRV